MPLVHWKTVVATALCAAAGCVNSARGQSTASVLYIELQNVVEYQVDVSDLSKWGANSNITQGGIAKGMGVACAGVPVIGYGDIVSVNGQPARGTYAARVTSICLSPNPIPGVNAIADTTWPSKRDETFEILQSDGVTPVGTIMTIGLHSGSPTPPGPPAGSQNYAIVGGTGAFFGVRGQKGQRNALLPGAIGERTASITEDPAKRRQNGGGHVLAVLYVIPMSRPEIATTSSGAAVFHSDFTPLTAAKPARAREVLIVQATGLGPTVPGVDFGQPFPTGVFQQVNSPVDVTVNGKPADVINKIGWPGLVDTYRVDFRVPDGTVGGTAAIQLTAAWIAGTAVNIPTQ
jgi:uncharacterized protein (TIGR03437 family)